MNNNTLINKNLLAILEENLQLKKINPNRPKFWSTKLKQLNEFLLWLQEGTDLH
jgi:hypothetical protein